MNLRHYVEGAITTESRIAAIEVDKNRLVNVLEAVIAAGNLLDVIKKDTYYGLPTNETKIEARADRLAQNESDLLYSANQVFNTLPAAKTTLTHIDARVAHAIIGLATESVELLEALLESIDSGSAIDRVNILEELGDLNWYHAIAIDALGGDWEQVQQVNLQKLAKRNKGTSFNAAATIDRDVETERKLLEDKFL